MKISYKWLQQYFEGALPEAKTLAETINSHVFEVEEMEEIASSKDVMLDVKVMPDRAHYALCHRGIAREIKAITGLPLRQSRVQKIADNSDKKIEVKIEAAESCKRYMARRIEGVKVVDSPKGVRNLLEAVGGRAINNIVDATNYVMLDIGQPLHAFDADKVRGTIVVRKAKNGEKIELLPETINIEGRVVSKERVIELCENDLVIADDEGALAIAGVKGGRRAEISSATKNIIIESANFNPVSVRRTATHLNLRNDSSRRFENEIIPELAEEAMDRVCTLINELSPEAKYGPLSDVFLKPTERWTVNVSAKFVEEKLGFSVTEREVKDVIDNIECELEGRDGEMIILPPLDRLDLKIPEDFVDEVARIKGYEKLPSALPPKLSDDPAVDKAFYWGEKTKNILVKEDFSEVLLYSLVEKGSYNIEYALASDKSALRESIVPKMKESLKMNSLNADLLGLDCIKIFEIGKVFPVSGEKTVLTMGVNQVKKKKAVNSETILKDTLELLKKELAVAIDFEIIKDGQMALVELDFDMLVNKMPATESLAALNFTALPKDKKYEPFSPYPFIVRDVAVFVPENVTDGMVWRVIEEAIGKRGMLEILYRHDLFDTYKKETKISYAYRIVFQSSKETLRDTEINSIMEAVYSTLKENGWEVR